jgi:hypothetical protein
MTLEELIDKHPDLYSEIYNKGWNNCLDSINTKLHLNTDESKRYNVRFTNGTDAIKFANTLYTLHNYACTSSFTFLSEMYDSFVYSDYDVYVVFNIEHKLFTVDTTLVLVNTSEPHLCNSESISYPDTILLTK